MLNINIMEDSFFKYIPELLSPVSQVHKVFENNQIIINSKIDKLVTLPKNINDILNIDSVFNNNIIHVPMSNNLTIEYNDNKYSIQCLDLNANNINNDNIKILSPKQTHNLYYQDIIIETGSELVIIQIYNFKNHIDNITHGAFIIYQNDNDTYKQNNSIFYTRDETISKN